MKRKIIAKQKICLETPFLENFQVYQLLLLMIFYYKNLLIINCLILPFFLGRPVILEDENNPDWGLCQNLGYKFGCVLNRKSDLDIGLKDCKDLR